MVPPLLRCLRLSIGAPSGSDFTDASRRRSSFRGRRSGASRSSARAGARRIPASAGGTEGARLLRQSPGRGVLRPLLRADEPGPCGAGWNCRRHFRRRRRRCARIRGSRGPSMATPAARRSDGAQAVPRRQTQPRLSPRAPGCSYCSGVLHCRDGASVPGEPWPCPRELRRRRAGRRCGSRRKARSGAGHRLGN